MNINLKSKIPFYTSILAGVLLTGSLSFMGTSNVGAANMAAFDPSNIMSDAVMSNNQSMNEAQIQAFLFSKNTCNDRNVAKAKQYPNMVYNIKNGKFVCLAEERFNGESAARILWQAGQDYSINPQALIVLLEKEQGLITDTWPNSNVQYRSAMGYGCPDTAACDTQYYGFKNQVRNAANFFRAHLNDNPCWNKPHIPGTQRSYWTSKNSCNGGTSSNSGVKYHPSDSCGATAVNIKNRATSGLYSYTPYQPNKAALNAGYGTGNNCSSYGNRNFWGLFNDWFGGTQYTTRGAIGEKYSAKGGTNGSLGEIKTNEKCGLINSGCFQQFQGGSIYWTNKTGAYVIKGGIGAAWGTLGYERGRLGYPTRDEVCGLKDGGCVQNFQGGKIYWTQKDGARPIWGEIEKKWDKAGYEFSWLGYPTAQEKCGLIKGGCFQTFEGGSIYWSESTGSQSIKGLMRNKWATLNYEFGKLGYPTRDEVCGLKNGGCVQNFQGGKIYSTPTTGIQHIWGGIESKWDNTGYEFGPLGYPTKGEVCGLKDGGCFQEFQGGSIYWTPKTNSVIIKGNMKAKWGLLDYERSHLAYPTKDEVCGLKNGGCYQQFQNGKIYWTPSTGAQSIWGAIEAKWDSMNYEHSALGYPKTGELYGSNQIFQEFQGGFIYWTPANGIRVQTTLSTL